MIGMVEELERAQLGFKLEERWCSALMYVEDIVLMADSGMELHTMLEVVQAYVMRWRIKFHSRKSKIVVVGKSEGGTSWKIGEEIMKEVEEFKYLCVWFERKLRDNVPEKMKNKAEEWVGKMEWLSRGNGQVEVDRGRMVWELIRRLYVKHAAEVWWSGNLNRYR